MSLSLRTLPRLVLACGLLFLAACGGRELPPLEPVAHPDLAAADEAVRRQLNEAQAALDKAVAGGEPAAAAAAFGKLGELYLAYQFNTPAGALLRNAEKLDPGSFVWPYEQGLLAQAAGEAVAARGHFERALAKNPGYAPAQAHLVECALLAGDAAGARALLAPLAGKSDYGAFAAQVNGEAPAPAIPIRCASGSPAWCVPRDRCWSAAARRSPPAGRPRPSPPSAGRSKRIRRKPSCASPWPTPWRARASPPTRPRCSRRRARATPAMPGSIASSAFSTAAKAGTTRRWRPCARRRASRRTTPAAQLELAGALVALEQWNEAGAGDSSGRSGWRPRTAAASYLQAMVMKGRGQAPAALDQLRALVAQDPGDAATRDAFIEALAAAGKTTEALEVYRAAAKLPATSQGGRGAPLRRRRQAGLAQEPARPVGAAVAAGDRKGSGFDARRTSTWATASSC